MERDDEYHEYSWSSLIRLYLKFEHNLLILNYVCLPPPMVAACSAIGILRVALFMDLEIVQSGRFSEYYCTFAWNSGQLCAK